MSLFAELFADGAELTNEVFGVKCTYVLRSGNEKPDMDIVIKRNALVKDNFSNIVGYADQAVILKSQLGSMPEERESFIDPDGNQFRIGTVVRETNHKWYVQISEM